MNIQQQANALYGGHGTSKPAHYWTAYEELLAPIKNKPIRLLELGVSTGASLAIWEKLLPLATIVGVDIDPRPSLVPDSPRVFFVRGSQGDMATKDAVMKAVDGAPFDIIIDDASHLGGLTRQAFDMFYPELKPGGTYVIEDCGASFMPTIEDSGAYPPPPATDPKKFPGHEFGIMGVVKQIMDEMFLSYSMNDEKGHIAHMNIQPHIAFIGKPNRLP